MRETSKCHPNLTWTDLPSSLCCHELSSQQDRKSVDLAHCTLAKNLTEKTVVPPLFTPAKNKWALKSQFTLSLL